MYEFFMTTMKWIGYISVIFYMIVVTVYLIKAKLEKIKFNKKVDDVKESLCNIRTILDNIVSAMDEPVKEPPPQSQWCISKEMWDKKDLD